MKKNFVLLSLLVFVFLVTNISPSFGASLPIIPGMNPNLYGMSTPGGSGRHLGTPSTTICKVTNLNNSGSGSLRYCLENVTSPKVIIFEVAGIIALQSDIVIGGGGTQLTHGSYVTIAGQTAPSPGITIKNRPLVIQRGSHDILIQHMHFRPGDENVGDRPDLVDAMIVDNHIDPTVPYNIVIDHCSFSWSIDENIELGGDNVTFSNNIISEGLASPLHPKGPHSKGLISLAYTNGAQGAKNVILFNNILAHNRDRNPMISAGDLVVVNNVIYDVQEAIRIDDHTSNKGPIKVAISANYIMTTSIIARYMYVISNVQQNINASSRFFIDTNNYFNGAIQSDPWNNITVCSQFSVPKNCSYPLGNKIASSAPIWPTGYTAMSAAAAYTYVLTNAGARPADRDSIDERIISEVQAASTNSNIPASQDDVGGYDTRTGNRSLTTPANPHEVQPSGYTNLEEWLHGYLEDVEGEVGAGGISAPSNLRIVSP